MKIQKKTKKSLKPVIIFVVAVLLIAGSIGAYFLVLKNNQEPADTPDDSSVNYEPPTKQEVDSSQDGKKQSAENEPKDNESTGSTKKTAQIGVSFADIYKGNLEIRAFVNNVIEGSGTCTASVKLGDDVITKSSEAFIDASSSQCKPIYIPTSNLKPGTWTVVVKFSSPDAEGTSEIIKVDVK